VLLRIRLSVAAPCAQSAEIDVKRHDLILPFGVMGEGWVEGEDRSVGGDNACHPILSAVPQVVKKQILDLRQTPLLR